MRLLKEFFRQRQKLHQQGPRYESGRKSKGGRNLGSRETYKIRELGENKWWENPGSRREFIKKGNK